MNPKGLLNWGGTIFSSHKKSLFAGTTEPPQLITPGLLYNPGFHNNYILYHLVGGLGNIFLFSIVYRIILPIDFHIFSRWLKPPTSHHYFTYPISPLRNSWLFLLLTDFQCWWCSGRCPNHQLAMISPFNCHLNIHYWLGFGTFFIFPYINWEQYSQLTFIFFQRGRYTTNQIIVPWFCCWRSSTLWMVITNHVFFL